jgi:hypothetical protein
MAALAFLAVSTVQPPPAGTGITAEQAMANYRAMLKGAAPSAEAPDCAPSANGEIVVCHRDVHPQPRLPMPDDRAEAGEAVHHLGEPASALGALSAPTNAPQAPSRQMQTLGKLFGLLKGAVTGEDSGN